MLILSLNVRGLGKDERAGDLSKLIYDTSPAIILLQETMSPASIAIETIANLLPGWELYAINALGLTGGLLSCSRIVHISPFKTAWGVLMEGKLGFLNIDVRILNMYAPYNKRDCFRASLSYSGLNTSNLNLAGYLNFTTSPTEIWGHNAKLDSMVDFFIHLLRIFDLVDIIPPVLEPT